MYFTIQHKANNTPILRGLLQGFGIHTSATESNKYHDDTKDLVAFYVCMQDVEVLDEKLLNQFELIYRLDDKAARFSGADTEKRNFYVFNQPKLRGRFSYIITKDGYKSYDKYRSVNLK